MQHGEHDTICYFKAPVQAIQGFNPIIMGINALSIDLQGDFSINLGSKNLSRER